MLLVKALSGSRLHGTHSDTSDYDYRGVYIAPIEQILGYEKRIDTRSAIETEDSDKDTVYWELAFFIRMCVLNSSNAMDVLFTPDNYLIKKDPIWNILQRSGHVFVSQRYIKETLRHKKAAERELESLQGNVISAEKTRHIYKNAAHVARLLIQSKTLADTGKYDPSNLLDVGMIKRIKAGTYTAVAVKRLLDLLERELLVIDFTHLPPNPNEKDINELTKIITRRYIHDQYSDSGM